MELVHVKGNTYYIKNPTNIGVYKVDEDSVYLIDTGNDQDAGKKILKILEEKKWNVKGIITTHSNADHIGGNKIIQNRTSCPIYAHGIEKSITENPILEPSFLYGGYPFKDLQNKFLMAKESKVTEIEEMNVEGLEHFPLKGHFFDMIGIKTKDNVYFLSDSLFSQETIQKYSVFFLYNVREYLNTLDFLKTLEGDFYIPSHSEITNDITPLIELNRKKIEEIADCITNFCKTEKTQEEIFQYIFEKYHLQMNLNQYFLIGSTIKSYLSYLYEENKITFTFENNKMYWKKIEINKKD